METTTLINPLEVMQNPWFWVIAIGIVAIVEAFQRTLVATWGEKVLESTPVKLLAIWGPIGLGAVLANIPGLFPGYHWQACVLIGVTSAQLSPFIYSTVKHWRPDLVVNSRSRRYSDDVPFPDETAT